MNRQKIDTADTQKMQSLVINCFSTAGMPYFMALAQERGIDIMNEKAMETLSMEIGSELMKQRCEAFMRLSMISTREEAERMGQEVPVQSTSGTLVRIDTRGLRYFVVRDKAKKEHSFIWYGPFEGSVQFLGDKVNKFIGRNVTIRWKEKQVYLPSAKNYVKVKEIAGIGL
jgi:hypothetical protein